LIKKSNEDLASLKKMSLKTDAALKRVKKEYKKSKSQNATNTISKSAILKSKITRITIYKKDLKNAYKLTKRKVQLLKMKGKCLSFEAD